MMSVDVCIIGSGVAGAIAAYKLATNGKTVVLLDSGPRFDFLDKQRYDYVKRGGEAWDWQKIERDKYEEYASPSIWLNSNRVKGIGGTTLQWNAHTDRLQPKDFEMHTLFGIGVDWPISYDVLSSWYSEAEQELGVSGSDSLDAPPRETPFPNPAHPISFGEKKFLIPAFESLGLSIGSAPLAINSQKYDNRPKCSSFGTCIPMCPNHAKYTAMAHVIKAEATGKVIVRPNSHVRRIKLGSKRKVQEVEYISDNKVVEVQRAKAFIIAAGGVEIPRLLLLSGENQDGLANSSKLVGRNYMTHPRITMRGMLPERVGSHRTGFNSTCSWSLYNHEKLPEIGNVLLKPTFEGGPDPASIAFYSKYFGQELREHIQKVYGFEAGIHIQGEMLPFKENKVTLSNSKKDCFGDPIPRIEMKLSNFDKTTLKYGSQMVRNIFNEMKMSEIRENEIDTLGNHIIGTTRMGLSSKDSVCDEWGRCHDLDNLFISSSSLFPTSACASPTLTIAALALRTADYMTRNF